MNKACGDANDSAIIGGNLNSNIETLNKFKFSELKPICKITSG